MSAEVTLTDAERVALHRCQTEYASGGSAMRLLETVERIVAARVEQARADERERIAQAIDVHEAYWGGMPPGEDFSEGLLTAARIVREAGPR